MALLLRLRELARRGSQFLIATHSPILLALPGATILHVDPAGAISQVGYDEAEPVALTREFLADPPGYLGKL